MPHVIVIGAPGETRFYTEHGLRCFEPARGRLIERVVAERARCDVLAMTRTAYRALPRGLAHDLREQAWPTLAMVPKARDTGEAAAVANRLRGMYAGPTRLAA